jgi:hypothetical protein
MPHMSMTLLPHMFFAAAHVYPTWLSCRTCSWLYCRACFCCRTCILHMFFCFQTCIPYISSSFNWFKQLSFNQSFKFGQIVILLKIFKKNRSIQGFTWFEQTSSFLSSAQPHWPVGFFVSTSFFELSQFEQLNITQLFHKNICQWNSKVFRHIFFLVYSFFPTHFLYEVVFFTLVSVSWQTNNIDILPHIRTWILKANNSLKPTLPFAGLQHTQQRQVRVLPQLFVS